jgi:predicted nuclease of predicted toxin-antitoxin system
MEMAIREDRIIITFDRDYGELVYRFGYNPPGVIYLRLKNFTPEEPAELLQKIDIKGELTFEGFFTVISSNEIRQRKIT